MVLPYIICDHKCLPVSEHWIVLCQLVCLLVLCFVFAALHSFVFVLIIKEKFYILLMFSQFLLVSCSPKQCVYTMVSAASSHMTVKLSRDCNYP